jgi:hypothetical protein
MALTGKISASVSLKDTRTGDLAQGTETTLKTPTWSVAAGTGPGQADLVWSDTRTLAPSGTEDLNLVGVLLGLFGTPITFVKLKQILVAAADGNTNNVVVSRHLTAGVPIFAAAGDAVAVLPGGWHHLVGPGVGVTVTPTTGNLITVTNSGGTTDVTYDVILVGTSA